MLSLFVFNHIMKKIFIFTILWGVVFQFGISQQFPAKKLNQVDGLPPNLYRVVQDGKGYMWILSEEGVARYDGKDFDFIDVSDGLPDDDVFNFVADKQGRNWLINNSNQLVYYKNDSIYHVEIPTSNRLHVLDKNNETIDITDRSNVYSIDKNDSISATEINAYIYKFINPDNKIEDGVNYEELLHNDSLGEYLLDYYDLNRQMALHYLRDFYYKRDRFDSLTYEVLVLDNDPFKSKKAVFQHCIYSKTLQFYNKGFHFVFDYDYNLLQRLEVINPKNRLIRSVLKDINGDYWFVSKDEILIIDKNYINNDIKWLPNTHNINVLELKEFRNELIFLSSDKRIYSLSKNTKKDYEFEIIYSNPIKKVDQRMNKIELKGNQLFLEYESKNPEFINLLQRDNPTQYLLNAEQISSLIPIVFKSFSFKNDSILLLATRREINLIDLKNNTNQQIFDKKAIAYDFNNHFYFFASRDTLTVINKNLSKESNIEIPFINNVYTLSESHCITTTKLNEVFICDENDCELNKDLEGYELRKIKYHKGFYWLVHKEGLLKSTFHENNGLQIIEVFNLKELLRINQINDLIVKDSLITIATDKGIFELDYNNLKIEADSFPIHIEKIVTERKIYKSVSSIDLPYKTRNFTIHCKAPTFKGRNPPVYIYKINDKNETILESNNGIIRYSNLNPGKYTFQIYAINEFGSISDTKKLKINIRKPWWQTWIFYIICTITLIYGITSYINYRIKKLRNTLKLEQKFAELELNALQSQMNPHFIFNSMSSMQNLIQQKDFKRSEIYLSKFSKLMRMYLESSKQKYVSIQQELEIIKIYFELEKLRFKDKISLQIINNLDQLKLQTKIPSSLIQPFIENAINHGLFHKNSPGTVFLKLYEQDELIIIEIEDNGIGRIKSEQINKGLMKPVSRALSIINDKINAIKKMDNYHIEYSIIDLYDENKISTGTKVLIRINVG